MNVQSIVMMLIALLVSLTVHEYAHARAALAAGDDTAEKAGRISLNPLAHLDPVGTVMMILTVITGFGIGWGKPVPVNPLRFRSPRWDSLKVSLWGPLSNMILAVIFAIVYRVVIPHFPDYQDFVWYCVIINLSLAIFNLVPVPPLDGSHILSSLLPVEAARQYDYTIGRYGMMILVALIVIHVGDQSLLHTIIGPPIDFMLRLLVG